MGAMLHLFHVARGERNACNTAMKQTYTMTLNNGPFLYYKVSQ